MENTTVNTDKQWYEHRLFKKGYGVFPYIIVKRGYAMYMQIPIHFNFHDNREDYPGTNINEVSETDIADYQNNTSTALHDRMIEHCKWIKSLIEKKIKVPCRLSLVEGPDKAYYFEDDTITFNSSIPNGGTLLTQDEKVLAMNVKHYISETD